MPPAARLHSQPAQSASRELISVDEALDLVVAEARPLRVEAVRLEEAGGRVLASPVIARRSSPPVDVSAMDGYAVRDADLAADWNGFSVIGEAFAGRAFIGALTPGGCVRVTTGAPAPAGTDRVIVQEAVRAADGRVFVPGPAGGKPHLRRAACDFRDGETLVEAGCILTAGRLLAAAAADLAAVEAYARPRVAIMATGDELVAPGAEARAPGAVPDSVSFGVAELARVGGAEVVVRRRLPDDPALLTASARAAIEAADVVVIIGGASVGPRDYARAMFQPLGVQMVFSKVAMKPGKPVWLGRCAGAHVLGLPGNPTAAMVTARLLLAPLLAGLSGLDPQTALQWRPRPLAARLEANGDWDRFVGGQLIGEQVLASADRDSSAQSALARSDVLIRREAWANAASEGDDVQTLSL